MSYNLNALNEQKLNEVVSILNVGSKQSLINLCLDLSLPLLESYFNDMKNTLGVDQLKAFKHTISKISNKENSTFKIQFSEIETEKVLQ